MIYLVLLLALAGGYEILVRWQMAQAREEKYNAVFARVLRFILPDSMRCIALWRIVWLLYHPVTDPMGRGKLTEQSRKHEFAGHIDTQWAEHPRAYPFMYQWENLRNAVRWFRLKEKPKDITRAKWIYNQNFYEELARAIAGEPSRL